MAVPGVFGLPRNEKRSGCAVLWQISLFGFLLLAFYDLDMLTEGVGIYYHGVPGRLAIANQPGNATVMYRKVKSEDIVGPPQHDAHANTNEKSR